MLRRIALAAGLSAALMPAASASAQDLVGQQREDLGGASSPIVLPKDDGAHAGHVVEWWQWWLHLEDARGRRYGATVVFFHLPFDRSLPRAGAGVRRTDVRITDVERGVVRTASSLGAEPMEVLPGRFRLAHGGQRAQGGGGRDALRLRVGEYALDLRATARRAPVIFFNPAGVLRLSALETARLYERQRMTAVGTLGLGGRRMAVKGTAWFEHGWTSANVFSMQWDFFHLELRDGRDVQLAQVRRAPGAPVFLHEGTIRHPDGRTEYLADEDFDIVPRRWWRRDATCEYPVDWTVRLRGERLDVRAVVDDQEVTSQTSPLYWDGSTTIGGDVAGRGVLELLNYCVPAAPGTAGDRSGPVP